MLLFAFRSVCSAILSVYKASCSNNFAKSAASIGAQLLPGLFGFGRFAPVEPGHHIEAEQPAFKRAVKERRLACFL